ncbi:MAG: dialkylresorcinol condensing enzyme [Pseudomonadota bacterium]
MTNNKNSVLAKKRILVPLYSQSGQLTDITQKILAPLQEANEFDIVFVALKPVTPYPFPWPFFQFLDAFPESIYQVAPPLEPLALLDSDEFDLIILPYQVWYLAPSLPVTALLQDPVFKRIAAGKPVVTIIACRNMWHLAQEKMKKILQAIGARLLDNVVLTDQGGTFATFITVPRWLWTGRSNAFWGLPAAGVHPDEIQRSRRFGLALRDALRQNQEKLDQPLLAGLGAVNAEPTLLVSEGAATRSFIVWGKLVRALGPPGGAARIPVLFLYMIFLKILIITVVPISLMLQLLLRPFLRSKLAAAKHYFESPSGSGKERLNQYE